VKTKIVLTTNIFVGKGKSSKFDHPADADDIKKELDYRFLDSLSKMDIPEHTEVIVHALVVGAARLTEGQKQEVRGFVDAFNSRIETHIFFPPALLRLVKRLNAQKICGLYNYSKIRNLAFILASIYDADLLIQVDTDQYIPRKFLLHAMENYQDKDIYCWSGLYREEGLKITPVCDPLELWPKFSSMIVDASKLIAEGKIQPALFAKGGNMLFKKGFFKSICYPVMVTRGEDFALALRSWLIYHNGNRAADIEPYDERFKIYLDPCDDAAVIHYTQHKALLNFLSYLERNLMRFAVERVTFYGQEKFSYEELGKLSVYLSRMILAKNSSYKEYVRRVYSNLKRKVQSKKTAEFSAEVAGHPVYCSLRGTVVKVQKLPYYSGEMISNSLERILDYVERIEKKDLFRKYLGEQKEFIDIVSRVQLRRDSIYQELQKSLKE